MKLRQPFALRSIAMLGGWWTKARKDNMSRAHSFFLALLLAVLLAVLVPVSIALWRVLLTQISGLGVFAYSTMLACVAMPFLYAMLRRMK